MSNTTTWAEKLAAFVDELAETKPQPTLAHPHGMATSYFVAARHYDAKGDTAARTYWLERFQQYVDENAS